MMIVLIKEKVGWQRTLATLVGFAGIFTVVYGTSDDVSFFNSLMTLNNGTWYLIFAALLFAMSDIVNKKYVSKESNLSMLFYIACYVCVFALYSYGVTTASNHPISTCVGGKSRQHRT